MCVWRRGVIGRSFRTSPGEMFLLHAVRQHGCSTVLCISGLFQTMTVLCISGLFQTLTVLCIGGLFQTLTVLCISGL